MSDTTISQLIPIIQMAIGPVILISGAGLLLITMTNRFARVIDRLRLLSRQMEEAKEADRDAITSQLRILWKQAALMRRAIAFASFSVLLAAILIIAIFFTALFHLESAWLISALFIVCMLSLIFSLIEFIRDINQSLVAIKLEVKDKSLNTRAF